MFIVVIDLFKKVLPPIDTTLYVVPLYKTLNGITTLAAPLYPFVCTI